VFTVPGYHVDQLIGYGSHAEVFSARLAATGEPVALKRIILHPAGADPARAAELAAALARSARGEAALLATLEHPGLIRLRQYLQTSTAAVLVMDLAEGGSLAQLLRRRDRLSPAEVAATISRVAAALAYAHDEGVLHGDVSAANILFTAAGQPKLADLGVARMLIDHADPDRALGTPAYLDPVLAAGGAAGQASDVFSLAAVALHCVTGAGPWQAGDRDDVRTVLARAATGVIEDLPGRLAGCPEAMAAVLSRALDPEPHRRGSAAEFALDLGASVPGTAVVLGAGRVVPRVGRHSAERDQPTGRDEPAGGDAVPADLTHVARLQVRGEPVPPSPGGRRARWLSRRPARGSAIVAAAVLGVAGVALGVTAFRGTDGPSLDVGQQAGAPVAPAVQGGVAATVERPRGAGPVQGGRAEDDPAKGGRAEDGRADDSRAKDDPAKDDLADPDMVLRTLADRRAQAFASARPDLLAGVYQSPALLAQDLAQLRSRIPAGCGLTGLRTEYQDVTVTSAGPQRLELQVTARQPPASLVCAGTVRSRTLPAGATRLALSLVRVGAEFRIASQRPGGP
jgi:tRNA A-37 threonylcarbamoyl transferase component Bud32